MFITTGSRWDDITAEGGEERERQLQSEYWRPFLEHGSQFARFAGDFNSAWTIIDRFHSIRTRKRQTHMAIERKDLAPTSAYQGLEQWLNESFAAVGSVHFLLPFILFYRNVQPSDRRRARKIFWLPYAVA